MAISSTNIPTLTSTSPTAVQPWASQLKATLETTLAEAQATTRDATAKIITLEAAVIPTPVAIAKGGTGAITAPLARVALGAAASSGSTVQTVGTETGAVTTGTTIIPLDDTIPQSTEGDQYLSIAITPTNASSTLYIDVVWIGASSAGGSLTAALFQDATANALAAAVIYQAAASNVVCIGFRHKMVAGTTSATTFKVRGGNVAAGTTTFNGSAGARLYGGVMASSITIREVLP